MNIVLIGMPAAGKSTVGVLLAKKLAMEFVDTDILIQQRRRSGLQEIVDTFGYRALREIEEEVIVSLDVSNAVIATGGSAVYSGKAVTHLRENGKLVYLKADRERLLARIDDYATRGIAAPADQTFESLFEERTGLYERYGDVVIGCGSGTHDEVVSRIMEKTGRR